MNRECRLFLVLTFIIVMLISLVGCQKEAKVLATVNGDEITDKEVEQRFALEKTLEPTLAEAGETAKEGILELLIDEQLLLQAANQFEITVSNDEVEDTHADLQTYLQNQYPSEADLEKALKKQKLTSDDLKEFARRQLLIMAVYQQVTDEVLIEAGAIQDFYNGNKELFEVTEQIRARHILVKEKEMAEQILERALAGEDFAALAEEHSEDTMSKSVGGDLGFFGRGDMVQPFETAVFEGEIGQVIDKLIETQFGFHIIKVEEKKPAHTIALEEIEESIENHLREQQKMVVFQEFMAEKKTGAQINLL